MTLFCPGVDVERWQADNRVRLYPDRLQTWILARATDRDKPSDAQLQRMARAVMAKWFGEAGEAPVGDWSGAADLITVGKPSPTAMRPPRTLQTRSELPSPPLVKPGGIAYVPVTFAWRARETSLPWPTWKVSWGLAGPCPQDADWMLAAVGATNPRGLEPAPKERTTAEKAGGLVAGAAGDLGRVVLPAIPWWVPATLGVVGAAYVVRTFRR